MFFVSADLARSSVLPIFLYLIVGACGMVLSLGPVVFGEPLGFWALTSLVPLILLYLIRPKPKQLSIPSLMFFLERQGRSKVANFFKQVTKDWLFLIQLLILFLLAVPFSSPYTVVQHDITAESTVIVLDVSASSQVRESGGSRFEIGLAKAKEALGSKNTVVLAKDVPLVGVQGVSVADALKYLNSVHPRDTSTRLGESILLAGELLQGHEGRVVVISDFVNTAGVDAQTAMAVLRGKKVVVDAVSTASSKGNVGFTGVEVRPDTTSVLVRNFNLDSVSVSVSAGDFVKPLQIPSLGTEVVSFVTPPGKTEVKLSPSDDFPLDNVAYISAPIQSKTKVLYITSNASVFLKTALLSIPSVELTMAQLPIIPEGDFDVYIVHDVKPIEILAGSLRALEKKAQEGKTVIVHGQEDSSLIDYEGLLPVKLGNTERKAPVGVRQSQAYTQNMEFGRLDHFFGASLVDENALSVLSAYDTPLLVVSPRGKGNVVWFGLIEVWSDFKLSPDFPIFWSEFLKAVTGAQDVALLNYKTGSTLLLNKPQTVRGPEGSSRLASVSMERQGFYELEDRTIAANLANEFESAISPMKQEAVPASSFELRAVREARNIPIDLYLIAAAFVLLFFELWYVKKRGDV